MFLKMSSIDTVENIYSACKYTYTEPHNIVSLLWGSEAAHAVLLYLSVSTHFTLHFPSGAFHIPSHWGSEGEEQSIGRHEGENGETLVSAFATSSPYRNFLIHRELIIYLVSSLVPRRKPAPLYRNLEIWDLKC